ncbi:MAG: hypothetical protein IPM95_04905 [Sphingobacteriales bacterium]|nr:hypothetical protein [Sphingobacteriales bacterium]
MKAETKKIYEAHVAFELEQFSKKNIKANIREDAGAVYQWLEKVKLKDIADAETVKGFLERNVKHYELSEEQKEYALDLAKHLHKEAKQSKHTVSDYLSEKRYNEIADKLIAQKEWREELIENMVKNPVYGEIIADTLYDGIKAFASQSGPSNETVGGSLFNLGKGILGAALSGVSDTIDKNIKKFIADNLSKTLKQSEQHLKDRFSDAKLRASSKSIWHKIEDVKISGVAKKIKFEDIEGSLEIGEQVVKDLLKNAAVKEISEIVIDHFFEYCNNKTVADLLNENGITQQKVIKETEEFAVPVLEKALKDGFLQERIEARLKKFYSTL